MVIQGLGLDFVAWGSGLRELGLRIKDQAWEVVAC